MTFKFINNLQNFCGSIECSNNILNVQVDNIDSKIDLNLFYNECKDMDLHLYSKALSLLEWDWNHRLSNSKSKSTGYSFSSNGNDFNNFTFVPLNNDNDGDSIEYETTGTWEDIKEVIPIAPGSLVEEDEYDNHQIFKEIKFLLDKLFTTKSIINESSISDNSSVNEKISSTSPSSKIK